MRVCARLTSQLLSTITSFDRRMRVERTLVQTLASQLSSTLTSFDRRMRVERTLVQTLASQLSSTLILVWPALMRVERTLVQTLASQLSSTLILVWPAHESWKNSRANSRFSTLINFHPRLTGAWELRELSCKLSLLNSHQLSSSFDRRSWELRELSCKLSLLNSYQLSPRLTRPLQHGFGIMHEWSYESLFAG